MRRYRFALRPRWILSHLFVLALVGAMVGAMSWQVDRLGQKRDRNDRVRSRSDLAAEPVERLAPPGTSTAAVDRLEYRTATASGRYLPEEEVLVRSRSNDGAPGSWVLTPLDLGDGMAVAVVRGWIPNSGGLHEVPADKAAPIGAVTVTGLVRKPETRGSFGPTDPPTGRLTDLARVDVARLDQQVPGELLPLYLQLRSQDPKVTTDDPEPVPAPALDEGPHLSYAVQWGIFTTCALVGYPLILRRRAREIEREEAEARLDEADPHDALDEADPRLDHLTGP